MQGNGGIQDLVNDYPLFLGGEGRHQGGAGSRPFLLLRLSSGGGGVGGLLAVVFPWTGQDGGGC
jgi:hypothetical protein